MLIEDFFVADNEQFLNLGLRDQHAVERILVGSRQHPSADSVLVGHRQAQELLQVKVAFEVLY